jgi:hypothetical protein
MTILEAGLKSSVFEAAKAYLAAGISILPLRGKQPALMTWATLQQVRPAASSVLHWHRNGQLSGVGVICGGVSGGLVVIDLDSAEAVAEYRATFPRLTHTMTVLSGSRRGVHFYYYVNDLPETTIAPQFELRSTGAYVAAPPSPHASGNLYKTIKRCEPLRLHNMDSVAEWIKAKRPVAVKRQPQAPARPTTATGAFVPREVYFRLRYVNAALAAQIQMLSATSEGNRNRQLYLSAVALGQLVGSKDLERSFVENELFVAARLTGLDEAEIMPTIKSGIDAGELSPRQIPSAPKLLN